MKTLAFVVTAFLTLPAASAVAGEELEETARAALVAFLESVISGPDVLEPLLAPEYQIMRANGVGYDREGYIEKGVGQVSASRDFIHEDIVATAHDDVMVVRYFLRIDETIDGSPVQERAPRLTVFRKIDGVWKVVAHSNFAATSPPQ